MGLVQVTILVILLFAVLFIVAAAVESRDQRAGFLTRYRGAAYVLALGVYCTSWTFYGSVGAAATSGWNYLPIYLGPVFVLFFGRPFLKRLADAAAEEQAASVSDFIAARFGHDIAVGRIVATICLLGTVPYIALQLRSIGGALSYASGSNVAAPAMIGATSVLAVFAIVFGIRRFEIAGRSEGLLFAIGLESLLKILALASVAALAVYVVIQLPAADAVQAKAMLAQQFRPELISVDTAVIFAISLFAVIVLPRQFYMAVVEAREPDDLPRAAPGLALYIAAMAGMVPLIALGGFATLTTSAEPDLFVLALPLEGEHGWVTAAALLGGISAAASMAIVDSTALATMVSNDLFLASVLRASRQDTHGGIGRTILAIRRSAVVGIMATALAWALLLDDSKSLASIGLIAFAAMAQFTPHLILGTYVAQRDPVPARASLVIGLGIWLYTLALPPILPEAWLQFLAATPLDPLKLFNIGSASPLVHGVFWSLGLNIAVFALLSARRLPKPSLPKLLGVQQQVRDTQGLVGLLAGFVGAEQARAAFASFDPAAPIDRRMVQHAQETLARVIGAAPARALVTSAISGGTMSIAQVTRLLDEGGQSLRFSRRLLAATFENIASGISVVDADMNLVAWNSRYLDMLDFPEGLVRVGAPVADLIRFNANRGDFGDGDVESNVEKRLAHLRSGLVHQFERRRPDGRVIKTVGGPMPGGGYVMSFTDITEEAEMRERLARMLEELEHRVEMRTHELSAANAQLAGIDREKTRFLAAASHDLLQPLHAARLFTAALSGEIVGKEALLAAKIDSCIVSAEGLLRALLDISRIDAGGVVPQKSTVSLGTLISETVEGLRPLAEEKELGLKVVATRACVETDAGLLRSIVQNLVSNAIRYTPAGRVLVGVRRRGERIGIAVYDTGVGIAESMHETVFQEFVRGDDIEAEGMGLGLALARRLARLLGGEIELASQPGRGSRFEVVLPYDGAMTSARLAEPAIWAADDLATRPLNVIVVDDQERVVEATCAMLTVAGHRPTGVTSFAEAVRLTENFDAAIVDLRLAGPETGLDIIRTLRRKDPSLPALIVTASSDSESKRLAAEIGVEMIAKPADPATIARFLAAASVRQIDSQ